MLNVSFVNNDFKFFDNCLDSCKNRNFKRAFIQSKYKPLLKKTKEKYRNSINLFLFYLVFVIVVLQIIPKLVLLVIWHFVNCNVLMEMNVEVQTTI